MSNGPAVWSRVCRFTKRVISPTFPAIISLAIASCGPKAGAPSEPARATEGRDHASTAHSHLAPHGGQVQSVGNNHFELTYDHETGRFSLYVLGDEESTAAPIAEKEITLQVRDERTAQFQAAKLMADPQPGESAGESSRFSATRVELANLEDFTAVARVPIDGQSHRVSFQFSDGKPMSAGAALAQQHGFACPMACEKNKVYPQPGKCPVCKMNLEEHKAGLTAHADHSPKHGGLFFMAPDNWHHLEGTLVSQQELRIYLYDNFTKPIDSTGYSGELKVQPVNEMDEAVGDGVTVPINAVPGKPYLIAHLPDTIKTPFQTEARLQFPKAKDKYLFNFDFTGVQHKE